MIYTVSFWNPVILSLETALVALVIIILLGTLAGKSMARSTFPGKTFLETIFLLPTVLPPTVTGFLLIIIFGSQSFIGKFIEVIFQQSLMFTWTAAVITATVVGFPFMYQSVKTGLNQVDENIEHAARTDGANEWHVFFFISLPLCFRSIVSGIILSFTRALGEFGATFMFAGNLPGLTQTVPIAIFTSMEAGNMELAWAWVLSIVIISFLMLFFLRTYTD
ncbi:molybdate transport system permease protein [Salibacterium salarium]|uniref:molybdate ABC transporter permease subunit n=1 Tax=Salibacterium salarium TaxID=284579 RepID=UPI0027800153|nr:molybdate ABC transporter permease subunit [Salibacterium salarium]MDQ0299333.1 molybdate transport system permease protein [Salibacterium salarium]